MSDCAQLASAYPLSPEQIAAFRRDGHVRLPGVASPAEMVAWRPELLAAVEQFAPETVPLAERDTYGRAFLQRMNLWTRHARAREFVFAERFARLAAELMGVPGVRLYHDQALFKEPGGGYTPWHQDQHYWPLDTANTVTLWMPLVDVTPEMGPMHFASGSHHVGWLGDLPISDESEARLEQFVRERGYPLVAGEAMSAGDATFHYGWTLHGAPGNSTDRLREVMTIIYFADGTRVGPTNNPNRIDDLERWLPGLRTGDLAASELNPLLYPADHA
ncbi:MAG: phytanoyl-CoA dioxygenase family protein [Armatimonadetes bacterium]|nr:phytanoyl-CoA dioxygenase family protein [Armatimonadota bacterium]